MTCIVEIKVRETVDFETPNRYPRSCTGVLSLRVAIRKRVEMGNVVTLSKKKTFLPYSELILVLSLIAIKVIRQC